MNIKNFTRNTRIRDLSKGLHSPINFGFQLEKDYQLEMTDGESFLLENGTIQTIIHILKAHKKLMKLSNDTQRSFACSQHQ